MFINIVIICLMVFYIAYIIFESFYIKNIRKSFKYVIHVNGIRGKSTTTRLIDAGLRNCGFKVFSKTTGTVPTMINVNNEDEVIRRLGKANIREQIKMMRIAKKQGAEVLVLECMAVNPNLQKICEEQILKSDFTIITNVREDHLDEMGSSLDDIALSLSNTIPSGGHLIINDSDYNQFFITKAKKKNTTTHIAKEYNGDDLDTFNENIQIALELARVLNLDLDKFYEGMKKYHHDIGAYLEIKLDNTIFLNGFSINDPESIKIVYDKIIDKYDKNNLSILLNNRFDRPTRVMQHIEMLKDLECKKLILFGANPNFIKTRLEKQNYKFEIKILNNIEDLKEEEIIFAIGNIGGEGMKILSYFKENGEII